MIVLAIEPEDIHVTLKFGTKELSMLLDFLDHCEMKYNGKEEPEMAKAEKYVTEEFFPAVNRLLMDTKREE